MFRRKPCSTVGICALWFSLTAAPAAAEIHVIVVKDYRFQPDEITVRVGDKVLWENQEKRQYHSVYFKQLGDPSGDYFFPGESREKSFDQLGDYPYICEPHFQSHNMKGVVHVAE